MLISYLLLDPAYQLALITPGMSPLRAFLRKQIRHISNFRRYPRGRPQLRQRVYFRTPNLGVRWDLAISDVFATSPPYDAWAARNGMPMYCRRSLDSSSV